MTTTTNQPTSSSSPSSQTRTSTQPLHHQSNIPSTSDENVFLFLPNLIGYTRIILAAVSLHFMSYHPIYCTIAYIISQLLDAVDGQVARMLGQTSKFGAVLDMVTDRCTTSCLLCFLSSVYPQWAIMFQSLIALDFASHYIHMYSSMVAGSKSHKTVSKKQSRILHSYYTNSNTLFLFCAGNELFFVCLYLAHWYAEPLLKGHEYRSLSRSMTRTDRMINSITLPQLIAVLTFPICAGKQIINVVQFWKASKSIVESDLEDRWKARQKKS
ncbi:CDP-diacylglycerol-inositol 3-phosphatidyltransferase [Puccinia graminis f. sp. tritici]|uniref:CDP-diacylglycerol--inositol 3-phosphatidyltransferase n=2 Tax=Puccinia graminis f. sp. tritici TaxID=56615 RepID=E3JV79_PUCGT|nr:uncharacterized protein PGTG_01285 [Puccinia graminis f. sp. tritici CRL 75-36-700-3]EFP75954.2 hypothetical protein PGTG_01285 [Puccinia graminis f. sp. tritici CRL 75-36-700-3]KAA1077353.1 CDP-diacylglycerol-inositol 3-phosphatidyltransferase [Puccinia graminis f. sp. tritici]